MCETPPQVPDHVLQNAESLLLVLLEKAMLTACEYVKAANRSTVTSTDIQYALMYEAHEFWQREDIEERCAAVAHEDCEDCEEFTRANDSACDLAKKMNMYHDTWNTWAPDEPAAQAMKRAIDQKFKSV